MQQEYLMYDTYADIYAAYPTLSAFKTVALDDANTVKKMYSVFTQYHIAVPSDAELAKARSLAASVTDISDADAVAISLEQSTAALMTQLRRVTYNANVVAVENYIKTACLGAHISAFTAEQASLATMPTNPSTPSTPSTPTTPSTPNTPSGTTGTTLTGTGIPEISLGNIGDTYIDTASHNVYGPGIGADGLANTQIGGPDGTPGRILSVRFRASTSSALTSIRFYKMGNTGYGGGTGGSLTITIQGDDGTSSHLPDGKILASQTVACSPTGSEPGKLVNFASPATLVAGNLYHVVFVNSDPSPAANYVSLNSTLTVTVTTPRQPLFPDTDWALLMKDTGYAWKVRAGYSPIVTLAYANGQTAGMGYMERCYADYNVDGTASVRETFTVSDATHTVSLVGVRLRRISGTSALTVTVRTAAGTTVGTTTIPAASITTGTYGDWATAAFATPFTLMQGTSYNLVLTTTAGTTYSVLPFRKGVEYQLPTGSYFKDGHAQQSPDGSTWSDVQGGAAQYDLQFYLDNITSAVYGPKTSTGWGLKSPLPNQ